MVGPVSPATVPDDDKDILGVVQAPFLNGMVISTNSSVGTSIVVSCIRGSNISNCDGSFFDD